LITEADAVTPRMPDVTGGRDMPGLFA